MPDEKEHFCIQEKVLGELIESNKNFKEFMREIKENHLVGIYKELKIITEKMASRRPSWTVSWIIAFLTTICGILSTALLMKR